LIFRSFEDTVSAITLACTDDIGASKPPIRPRFIENLCKIRSNQAIKSFLVLFLEKEQSKSTNLSPTTQN